MNKPFHFFKSIADAVFISLIGCFLTLFLIFLSLSMVFLSALYNQFCLFLAFGGIAFAISYKQYLNKYQKILKNLSYDAFITTRNELVVWLLWTFNYYLMACWFTLILIGSTNGFGFQFPTRDGKASLVHTDTFTTKILGLVLWIVHVFVLVVIKTVAYYWTNIILFAHKEFEKRRRNLEMVRNRAAIE
ncbi:hypothetical protein A6V39_04830 [Candidatus Mycoplasma haematobovis]|uniref:Uncharacterized protein n=1 Tax=Candidatus Mycoplasma haematobovis TaxID=432608 RepID=A0A1A9QDV0_9MOLU|nr:hypothetical protein [Candidatus Mycoplasma haematobovis]OAL09870.1 hypothetical protein A6V39_04830 [Candidatus Mycoplasma haematobovis]